jgi:hypothetical protein
VLLPSRSHPLPTLSILLPACKTQPSFLNQPWEFVRHSTATEARQPTHPCLLAPSFTSRLRSCKATTLRASIHYRETRTNHSLGPPMQPLPPVEEAYIRHSIHRPPRHGNAQGPESSTREPRESTSRPPSADFARFDNSAPCLLATAPYALLSNVGPLHTQTPRPHSVTPSQRMAMLGNAPKRSPWPFAKLQVLPGCTRLRVASSAPAV